MADYYEILGVPRGASASEVRTAYMKLARERHPDRFSDPAEKQRAQEFFKDATAAFNTLCNDRSRKAYDEGLARPRPAGGPEQIAREAYARGLEALEARAYQDAVDNMRAAVHHAPAEARYHAGLGIALSRNPRWIRDAIGEMERAIALEPGQPAFQAALAELYHRQGLTIRARRTLEAALAQAPSDPQLLRVARLIAGGEP